jgi:flagellin
MSMSSVSIGVSINQVSKLRGFLGAVTADSIEPNINQLQVHIENLSASLSTIRDLDFAEETANFTKTQILFQSGIAVLASANLIPQSILTLLG